MSFWRRFSRAESRAEQTEDETRERRGQVLQVANSKEEHYRVMRQLAVEAGDEDAARFYRNKLNDLEMLQDELDVLMGGG